MWALLIAVTAMAHSELEIVTDRPVIVEARGQQKKLIGGSSSFNLVLRDGEAGEVRVSIKAEDGAELLNTVVRVPEGRKLVYRFTLDRLQVQSNRDVNYRRPTINDAQRAALGGSTRSQRKVRAPPVRHSDPFMDVLSDIRNEENHVSTLTIHSPITITLIVNQASYEVIGTRRITVPTGNCTVLMQGRETSLTVPEGGLEIDILNNTIREVSGE